MSFRALAIVATLLALPVSGLAQTAPPASAPAAAAAKPQGISREDYIKRAADSAAARFDRMDTDHDGVLTRDESRAYRESHHRVRRTPPATPAASAPAPAAPVKQQ